MSTFKIHDPYSFAFEIYYVSFVKIINSKGTSHHNLKNSHYFDFYCKETPNTLY